MCWLECKGFKRSGFALACLVLLISACDDFGPVVRPVPMPDTMQSEFPRLYVRSQVWRSYMPGPGFHSNALGGILGLSCAGAAPLPEGTWIDLVYLCNDEGCFVETLDDVLQETDYELRATFVSHGGPWSSGSTIVVVVAVTRYGAHWAYVGEPNVRIGAVY